MACIGVNLSLFPCVDVDLDVDVVLDSNSDCKRQKTKCSLINVEIAKLHIYDVSVQVHVEV